MTLQMILNSTNQIHPSQNQNYHINLVERKRLHKPSTSMMIHTKLGLLLTSKKLIRFLLVYLKKLFVKLHRLRMSLSGFLNLDQKHSRNGKQCRNRTGPILIILHKTIRNQFIIQLQHQYQKRNLEKQMKLTKRSEIR